MDKVNLSEKFALITEQWQPRVAATLNGQEIKLAKLQGGFVWHHHDNEDEFFMPIKGRLKIELRDRTIVLDPGEFFVVPKGVEHKPVAEEEVHLLIFEPAGTLNTGNVVTERTLRELRPI
jgi:mannose-6-phosphate isomerase-like protein (cupin superfamily)